MRRKDKKIAMKKANILFEQRLRVNENFDLDEYDSIMPEFHEACKKALILSKEGYGVYVEAYGSLEEEIWFKVTDDFYNGDRAVAGFENGKELFSEFFESPEDIGEWLDEKAGDMEESIGPPRQKGKSPLPSKEPYKRPKLTPRKPMPRPKANEGDNDYDPSDSERIFGDFRKQVETLRNVANEFNNMNASQEDLDFQLSVINATFDKYKEEVKVSDELYKSSMYNGERHGY